MVTPTKSMILEKAVQLFHEDNAKHGNASFITPTEAELRENGFLSLAQSLLMRDRTRHTAEEWQDYVEQAETLDFSIDVTTALKSGVYTCGTRGCGKSDLNMMLADRLKEANVIVLCFDPSLDWVKRSSIKNYLTVKPNTQIEIPVESQIYDLSVLTLKQQKEFVERFNRALFDYQITYGSHHWYFCIYEEAHQYFMQGVLRSNDMQYTVRLLTQGRNFKISMGLITQFSAMVDKNAIKFMEQRFFGASNEPNDTEYITRFFPKNERENVAETLRKLDSGQFLSMKRHIISIEPFESDIVKKQIESNTTPKSEPLPKITAHQKPDNAALLKFIIVSAIGIAFLLGAM